MTTDSPWVHGSDEDILFAIAHALRHEGRRTVHQADVIMARVTAERIFAALRKSYVITPKPPTPLAQAKDHPKMGGG